MPIPAIVGILNVTPDSYVDGGRYNDEASVVARAKQFAREGADIIEIGGESTGPGSPDVSAAEELRRVLSAVQTVHRELPAVRICVDTWKAAVAAAVVHSGASMINDITAGRGDPEMFSVAARAGCPLVLMYSKDAGPRTTKDAKQYDDVIGTIAAFLRERVAAAEQAGVARKNIIVDPGLGHFISADPRYSFQILDSLSAFAEIAPVLVSPSRKSFLAGPHNLPVEQCLPATLEASLTAMRNGASFIRTHDVAATRAALETGRIS
ncbi:MAG TPA: dihydropteroate synthase [Candidatus Peribacteria bacterium]|nr:dihydropteroate synthase [Candidatus Peribacteria bacterium]